ncbi:16S rRNA processing protein RimM [Lachnospiraceae bacterium TWA4]|nr:16S rRNA processing protein RimM [Lachnospiraceae bacterium TWA4]
MEQFFQIGIITDTHGLRGEVKVFPTTDDPYRYDDLDEVLLETKEGKKLLHVQNVKYFKQYVIVKFKEYNHINDIEQYKKCSLWVTRENAVPLGEDENYIADLIGLPVITDKGEVLGPLKDVMQTGANDVYVVEGKEKEILIPSIKQCILNVDLEKGEILVHLLEGLLDL